MARHPTGWTAPAAGPTGDGIWGAGLLAIGLAGGSGAIGLVVAWLFSLGPAAGLVGSAAGSLACWEGLVRAMASIDGR